MHPTTHLKHSDGKFILYVFTAYAHARVSDIIAFSRTLNTVRACALSRFSLVRLCATLLTVAHQAPLSREFSRQEYWSGLPFPPPEDLPDPGVKPESPALQADSSLSEPPGIELLSVGLNF